MEHLIFLSRLWSAIIITALFIICLVGYFTCGILIRKGKYCVAGYDLETLKRMFFGATVFVVIGLAALTKVIS